MEGQNTTLPSKSINEQGGIWRLLHEKNKISTKLNKYARLLGTLEYCH